MRRCDLPISAHELDIHRDLALRLAGALIAALYRLNRLRCQFGIRILQCLGLDHAPFAVDLCRYQHTVAVYLRIHPQELRRASLTLNSTVPTPLTLVTTKASRRQ